MRDGLRASGEHKADQCHNCHAPLTGLFCQSCGQKSGHLHKPVWELMHDFMHSVLHWDGRIWMTLRAMLFSPAKHANDWINGRQMRYVPPIRLFVFISVLLIVLLNFSDVVLWQLKKMPITPGTSPSYQGSLFSLQNKDTGLKEDLINTKNITIKGSKDSKQVRSVIAHFNDMMKRPKDFNAAVSGSLSKYLLLAVPLHALLLKIFYIRRKRYLMEHVIFSLQGHTVLFLLLLICVLLAWISRSTISGQLLFGGLIIAYSIHLFAAMKRFYGQGILRTSLKYCIIGFCYFALMITAGGLLLVRSMGGLGTSNHLTINVKN
jgi:hypothetical protein